AGVATTAPERAAIAGANYDFGLQLVRRGYVVAAPCLTPFGRRLGNKEAYKQQDACAVTLVRMQLLGKLPIAENLRDALWSLELLARQPNVDAARIGCVGLSLGGRMTMLTAAMSPKVRVAVISGALNMLQERILGTYSCGAQVIPGLLEYGDVPEIASLIAPRPCLWEVGNNDALMVKDRIPPALGRMKLAWSALDAATHLDVDRFEGKHQWNGVKAYPLLASVLHPESK
ncbi:MAG: dienelactone hydrolase family protein, partial [Bryobacteraceae bacterium]